MMLSNMHSNASSGTHTYPNQHPFSLNISPNSIGSFVNQTQEQDQSTNHPVVPNSSADQAYNLQKNSNNAGQTHTSPSVQVVNNAAPVDLQQPPVVEKSQSNGTSNNEEKNVVKPPEVLQKMDIDPLPQTESKSENEPSPKKTEAKDAHTESKPVCKEKADQGTVEVVDMEQDNIKSVEKASSKQEDKLNAQKDVVEEMEQEEDPLDTTASLETKPAKEEKHSHKKVSPETKQAPKNPRKTKAAPEDELAGSSVRPAKRQRIRTQHYQSPLPEVELVSKISSTSLKNNDEKLIVFYKNEFLAVRNDDGGFYLCQAMQNVYKSSPKIKIRWLSQDKKDEQREVYIPDFYDAIDFDCILTNLSLSKADKSKYVLPSEEKARTESILNRSLAVEKGEDITLTEEHPDGLDVSLYRDEDQLKKRKSRKRGKKAPSPAAKNATATRKSPKVRAVASTMAARAPQTSKKVPQKKSTAIRKPAQPATMPRQSVSPAKTSKTTGKGNNTKTSPVDQKKAKVLARIGKKTAIPASKASPKNNSKNGKSGKASTSKSTVQAKAGPSSNGTKVVPKTGSRKSARK